MHGAILMNKAKVLEMADARVDSIMSFRANAAEIHRRLKNAMVVSLRRRSLYCMIFGRHKSDKELLRWYFGSDLDRYPHAYQVSLHDSTEAYEHELQTCYTLASMAHRANGDDMWITDAGYRCLSLS